jgi:hypothetical protein
MKLKAALCDDVITEGVFATQQASLSGYEWFRDGLPHSLIVRNLIPKVISSGQK